MGSAVLVKTPVGVALMAGFAVVFIAFFVVGFESNFRVEPYPLFHLRQVVRSGTPGGFALDVLWLLLPALIVVTARLADPDRRSAPFLLMALAPLLVVNMTRMDNTMAGGGGTGGDWLQTLHPVPFLAHAFALSLASRRWSRLRRPRRVAFLASMALVILPLAAVAGHYSLRLLRAPDSGNDYVDNRSLAAALRAIPTRGTVVVTNDLRYPAGNFTRDDRQMQIPALFGHQAFAVNYAHEAVEDRRPLQELLRRTHWDDAINDAARVHGWTHLLVRKDYPHPAPIPLTRVFENRDYAVFLFP